MRSGIESLLAKQKNGLEKVHQLIHYQFSLFSKQPAIIMVIFAETSFQYNQELSHTVNKLLTQKKQLVVNILEEGIRDGSIRNDIVSEQLACIILGSMRFTVLQWRLSDFGFDLSEKDEELWHTLSLLIKPNK